MNVKALRKALESLPDEQLVVLLAGLADRAIPLGEVSEALYVPGATRTGDVYCTHEDLAEKVDSGVGGWDADLDAAPEGAVCVLLLEPVL